MGGGPGEPKLNAVDTLLVGSGSVYWGPARGTATINKEVRRAETQRDLETFHDECDVWLLRRGKQPDGRKYKSQLAAIRSLLIGAVEAMREPLAHVDTAASEADVYEECRLFDLRILWLRRVFRFFRDKFEQRDDSVVGPVLAAADEVVWSCYRQAFVLAEQYGFGVAQPPPPLPFVEDHYAAEARPPVLLPLGLRTEIDADFLRDHLNRLPVAVVRLPRSCVRSPWWLIFLAHEIGHHVQYNLLDRSKLVSHCRDLLKGKVKDIGGNEVDQKRWGDWSEEIFADLFSLVSMGQWALWAMVELELREPAVMTKRRDNYPSPAVRLSLLARASARLGLDAAAGLRGLDPEAYAKASPTVAADLAIVDDVLDAAMGTLPGTGRTLAELYGFDVAPFGPGGLISQWSTQLRQGGEDDIPGEQTLEAARLATSAAVAAWAEAMAAVDDTQREWLAGRALKSVTKSSENGDRDEAVSAVEIGDLGAGLAKALLSASPSELES